MRDQDDTKDRRRSDDGPSTQSISPQQLYWQSKDVAFVLVCCAYLYLHLFVFPIVPIFYEGDHLYFIQDAWRMYRGEAIYRDFFEYTFPGTQVLYLGLMYLFGTKYWLINAVIFFQAIAQTILGLAISKRIFGDSWYTYLAPALFLFLGFRWFGIDGSHRMLSPLFIWLAVLILMSSRSYSRLAWAGVLCALASFFTQQRGITAIAGIALFLAVEAYRNRTAWKQFVVSEAILGGAFIVTLLLLVTPFIASAGYGKFLDYTVFFLRDYVKDPTANYGAYLGVLSKVMEQGPMIAGLSVFYYLLVPWIFLTALLVLWRKGYRSEVLLVTLVGLGLAGGTFAPTPFRIYQISLAGLIILAWVLYRLIPGVKLLPKVAVLALVVVGLASAIRLQTAWNRTDLITPTGRVAFVSPVTLERYQWLTSNAEPGEYVFEVYQTAVNYVLQLPNPTRLTFLLDNGYTPQWQVDMAVEDLKEKKPRLIIWDANWDKLPAVRSPDDHLSPLYAYLTENYEMRQAFTPYVDRKMQIWERLAAAGQ